VSSSTFDDSGWPDHVRRIEDASVNTLLNSDHVARAYGPQLGFLKLAFPLASDFIFVYGARCCRSVRGSSGAIKFVNPEACARAVLSVLLLEGCYFFPFLSERRVDHCADPLTFEEVVFNEVSLLAESKFFDDGA
jgi:hypothetical protein